MASSRKSLSLLAGDLKSSSVKDRERAVDELSSLFSQHGRSLNPDDFNDKTFHEVLEATFQAVIREKPAYFDKKKAESTRRTVGTRLTKCAGLLRGVVNRATPKLGRRTLIALVEHITQILPGPDGDFVPPLVQDYSKALADLLSHQAHVELLARKAGTPWENCVDFLLDFVARVLPEEGSDEYQSLSRGSPAPSSRGLARTASAAPLPSQRRASQLEGGPLRNALQALHHLVSGVNAPLQRRAHDLLELALNILQMKNFSMGPIQTLSFAIFNQTFCFTQTEDVNESLERIRDIVKLMSFWWRADKVSQDELIRSLRNEITRTMLLTQHYLENTAFQSEGGFRAELEEMANTLWQEYSRRSEHFRLQMGDISFSNSSADLPKNALCLHRFGLRAHNESAEGSWVLLQNLALFESLLLSAGQPDEDAELRLDDHPRKRRRVEPQSSRLQTALLSINKATQRTALQLIPFIAVRSSTHKELAICLDQIASLAGDKDSITASWALIACECFISTISSSRDRVEVWRQVWHIGARSVSHPSTCRAACFLLKSMLEADVLPYRDIGEELTTIITSADVNGPATLSDSSIALMSLLADIRNVRAPNASQSTCSHIIRWLFFRWSPAEHAYASFQSTHVQPLDAVNLIRSCCGAQSLNMTGQDRFMGGSLGETWKQQQEVRPFTEYLLLLKPDAALEDNLSASSNRSNNGPPPIADTFSLNASRKLVCELMLPKVEEMMEVARSWTLKTADGGTLISLDRFQSIVSGSLLIALLLPQIVDVPSSPSASIEAKVSELLQTSMKAALSSVEPDTFVQLVLRLVRPVLPKIQVASLEAACREHVGLLRAISQLHEAVVDRESQPTPNGSFEVMDIDDEFESQASKHSSKQITIAPPRRRIGLSTSSPAFYTDTRLRMSLFRCLYTDPSQAGLLPDTFTSELLSAPVEDFLRSEQLLLEICSSDLTLNPSFILGIIETFGEIISQPSYQGSEIALTTCIDVLNGLHQTWLQDTEELSNMVGDLYGHFAKICNGTNILSPRAQMSFANLLLTLIRVDADYGQRQHDADCRKTLLDINSNGQVTVKYFVAERISEIFAFTILTVHDDVFVQVLDSLPTDPEDISGIALRMLTFCKLACKWPTLLRRSTYHIFEVPGNVPHAGPYATRCLRDLAAALRLPSARDLFRLFSKQLLYTWLESRTLSDLPYAIFGFESLSDLIRSVEAEVIAMTVMWGRSVREEGICDDLGMGDKELLQRNFTTTLAYSMNHMAYQNSQKGHAQAEGRDLLIDALGKQDFYATIQLNFVDLVALFLDLLDQEEPIEKGVFLKIPGLEYAAIAMKKMKDIAHSTTTLPPNQQPMFRPKHVMSELRRLCGFTEGFDLHSLWTPASVVKIARTLLNTVHPALGSLHACSVLRKIRILIALAGTVALESYPLEMLLNSIRSFLADTECANDALGMSQYLLAEGQDALADRPSFLAGYALSTLASLRVFLESSQSSTTQESQFKATMSKAQNFHTWLGSYLAEYKSTAFEDAHQEAAFEAITQSAAQIRASGSAEKDTPEAMLLLSILADEGAEAGLLNDPSRQLALNLLCGDFTIPDQTREDIIDDGMVATEYAHALWQSCRAQGLSHDFLAWAGRVIGRQFSASGQIPGGVLNEADLSTYKHHKAEALSSELGIIDLLQDLTGNADFKLAGLAEAALRLAATNAIRTEDNALQDALQRALTEPLYTASQWGTFHAAPSDMTREAGSIPGTATWREPLSGADWAASLSTHIIHAMKLCPIILLAIGPNMADVAGFAQKAFPYIIHIALSAELDVQQSLKKHLSDALKGWLTDTNPASNNNLRLLLNTLLYLRTQPYPKESSIADRLHWLDVDYSMAASAAVRCGMYKTSLLFAEIVNNDSTRSSRRSSIKTTVNMEDMLLEAFENIDDPDAYYGLPQEATLATVLARVEHEGHGPKSLAFRGAQYDSNLRLRQGDTFADAQALSGALGSLGLAGLSHSLLQDQQDTGNDASTLENTFRTARRLEVWNLPAPATSDQHSVVLYKVFQTLSQAQTMSSVRSALYDGLACTMKGLVREDTLASSVRSRLSALASLTELNDVLNLTSTVEADTILESFNARGGWMKSGSYDDVSQVLSTRGTTMSMVSQHASRLQQPKLAVGTLKRMEVESLIQSSGIYRYHKAQQESLNIATTLTNLIRPCQALGLQVDAAVNMEAANALWDFGEISTSIRILQAIEKDSSLKDQSITISRSDLLSKLGHQVSMARLEKPQDIQRKYLQEALKDIKGNELSKEAGLVFHQFAVFCDEQLQDPAGLEDLARLQSLKQAKSDEVAELGKLVANTRDTQTKNRYKHTLTKEEQWLKLDSKELQRVEMARSEFVRLSVENYLRSLAASDEHNNDALRFTALWLERSDDEAVNNAVSKHLSQVATRKFATLINQLTSRLQDQDAPFQRLLSGLVANICIDHPYHGMYQIWSGVQAPKILAKDEVATLRINAAKRVGSKISKHEAVSNIWLAIDKTSRAYHSLAMEKGSAYKAGAKTPIRDSKYGQMLATSLAKYRIPPPTMQMELSATKDYSKVPTIAKLEPNMSIASGVSAPKIITAVGTDGVKYRQLVKGGHDDLRQDAIMEQVFAAVSSLLKGHRSTQQRNLGIRTYKVLPLTPNSGLIEFVPNTIPLHEFLMPAHERYYPRDLKGAQCRKEIFNVQSRSNETRLQTFRKVTDKFHPVMRYFFMEYFVDPDEWFARRLAYTRSTAAISMLGHVLGLGDRHGHNILLDTKTGEAVHIDLGVAFEAGRILPVPELVPFRLTRDIVDGMGVTKTEGVFRRCCEFTLEALREEQYSIMTILDVLRYDPLYNWSISPLRMAKLQKARADDENVAVDDTGEEADLKGKKAGKKDNPNEPTEADRALEIVQKKLSKTLSVTATVNDLINQAMDEQNLAVLYSGWAAYA